MGWHRYTPSELGRSNPGWIAPEDFAGETVGKDGRKHPVLDSLHGTNIWREPRDYLGSLDAAMQLVPEGLGFMVDGYDKVWYGDCSVVLGAQAYAETPALALTAAALRAPVMRWRKSYDIND